MGRVFWREGSCSFWVYGFDIDFPEPLEGIEYTRVTYPENGGITELTGKTHSEASKMIRAFCNSPYTTLIHVNL